MVVLLASDGEAFTVPRDIAIRSTLVRNMLEDIGELDDPIPLPNVTSNILTKVLQYCEHHRGDPIHNDNEDLGDDTQRRIRPMGEWDQQFIDVDQDVLFNIILAANYLDIKSLLDLGCRAVANMIKGKSPEEIRRMFNIPHDLSTEEEEQIRAENAWAQEER